MSINQNCSVCGAPKVLTRNCGCRRPFLASIPYKTQCDPLRLEGSPAKLKFDVQIGTDIIPAMVDPMNTHSTVNGNMVKFLMKLRRRPENDNTINVEFKFGSQYCFVNCVINEKAEYMFCLGLTALLNVGFECSVGGTSVRGTPCESRRPPSSRNVSRSFVNRHERPQYRQPSYKYVNRQFRRPNQPTRRTNYTRDSGVVRYAEVASTENWDVPVERNQPIEVANYQARDEDALTEPRSERQIQILQNEVVARQDVAGPLIDFESIPTQHEADSMGLQPQMDNEKVVAERDSESSLGDHSEEGVEDVARDFRNINMEVDEDTLLADL